MAPQNITLRTDPALKQRLQVAAGLSNESLTAFVLAAADERADRVIGRQHTTELPGDSFDDFFDSPASEPTPALRGAASRLRGTVRRA